MLKHPSIDRIRAELSKGFIAHHDLPEQYRGKFYRLVPSSSGYTSGGHCIHCDLDAVCSRAWVHITEEVTGSTSFIGYRCPDVTDQPNETFKHHGAAFILGTL